MNKVILTGRIVRDAELNYIGTAGTPKMSFTIVCDRAYQKKGAEKKVDFIPCEMIGQHTEKLVQYVTKGKSILVEGELNIDQYTKDDEKRSYTKVKIDRLEFLIGNANTENKSNANTLEFTEFQEVDNDEIPF